MGGKRLITESDVRAMARGGDLVLGPDTIATPAALDLAFERGLRVLRGGASNSSSSAGGCGCGGAGGGACSAQCTWGRMLASDGVYVVVVKNGAASVSKLTDQGPQPFQTKA